MTLHTMRFVEVYCSETKRLITTIPMSERLCEQLCDEAECAGLTVDEWLHRKVQRGLKEAKEADERLGEDEVRRRILKGQGLKPVA